MKQDTDQPRDGAGQAEVEVASGVIAIDKGAERAAAKTEWHRPVDHAVPGEVLNKTEEGHCFAEGVVDDRCSEKFKSRRWGRSFCP